MQTNEVLGIMDEKYALFGLLFAFQNRLQTAGDSFYEEITSKQFFLLACMNLFPKEAPTTQDLASVMGCSHQNTKQLLNKLEQKGLVSITKDPLDKRKLRIYITQECAKQADVYHDREVLFMKKLFENVSAAQAGEAFQTLAIMEQNLINMKGE